MFDNIGKDTDEEARRRRAASLLLTSAGAASLLGLIVGIAAYTAVEVLQTTPVETVLALRETPEPELSPLPPPPPPPAGKAETRETPPDPDTPPEIPPDLDDTVQPQINDAPKPSGTPDGDENGDPNGEKHGIPGGTDKGEPCGGNTGRPCGLLLPGPRLVNHSELDVRTRVVPSYPEAARALALGEQRCTVAVSIDEEGKPYDVEVSQCPVVFHEASKAAILKWRWYPPKEGKNKIKVRTRIGITYRLD